MTPSAVVVLGAGGFLGSNLKMRLKKIPNLRVFEFNKNALNLHNAEHIQQMLKDVQPNVIFNCAAQVGSVHVVNKFPADYLIANTKMSLNLYDEVVKSKLTKIVIVNPISNCLYPQLSGRNVEGAWTDGDLHQSIEGYGVFKRHLVHLSRVVYRQHNIHTVNCMFPGIFGPGDSLDAEKSHALTGLITRAIEHSVAGRKDFVVWGTGKPVRDWLYIDDAVNAMIRASLFSVYMGPEPLNVTAKNHFSMAELAKMILKRIDGSAQLIFDTSRIDGVKEKVLEKGRFDKLFADFSYTPFEDALEHTIQYYKTKIDKVKATG